MKIDEFLKIDITKLDDIEKTYPSIVSQVMEYIIKTKQQADIPMIDIIHDFCLRKGYSVEYVGDAIQNDVYFKSFIESDCINHNLIKTDRQKIDNW